MKKHKACLILAVVVSCFALISMVVGVVTYLQLPSGEEYPAGSLLMNLVTLFCTFMIWKGYIQMDKDE